jgi:hypothetical protein
MGGIHRRPVVTEVHEEFYCHGFILSFQVIDVGVFHLIGGALRVIATKPPRAGQTMHQRTEEHGMPTSDGMHMNREITAAQESARDKSTLSVRGREQGGSGPGKYRL